MMLGPRTLFIKFLAQATLPPILGIQGSRYGVMISSPTFMKFGNLVRNDLKTV